MIFRIRGSGLIFLLCTFFQTGIEVDIDADHHSEEKILFFGMDDHIMKTVIVEYPFIYPFIGSAAIVNLFIFIDLPRHRGIKPNIPVGFCIDTAAIGRNLFCRRQVEHYRNAFAYITLS